MSKTLETTVEIKGAIGSSFTSTFRTATSGLGDLRKEARAVQQELDRLGKDFRSGKIHQSQYTEETRKLTNELNKLDAKQKTIQNIKNGLSSGWNTTKAVASVAAIGATTAIAATTAKAVGAAADFEAQMSKVAAKTSATTAEMNALKQSSLQLGSSSSLSASEVAGAMDELGAKGMNANNIIKAMPGMIAATEASGEDLALVSNVVTSAINAYGMSADKSSKIADIMAMSANKTAAGVEDLGFSFKYAAPVANTLGIKLEELAATTGILVDKGLAGEQAGTTLRMSLVRLSKPPKDAQKVLNKLGITVTDSSGKFKSLAKITDEWNKSTANLTDTQKVQYASTVFGTEAATGMLNLFAAGPDKINEMTNALENSSGTAAKAARIMKDNYAGAKEQMLGSFESAQIAFATPILPVLQDAFNGISSIIENNMGTIENAGESVAKAIKDITDPFATTKPVKPVITPDMNFRQADELISQYQKGLEKYELFSGMDTGDKVEYMLDTAVGKMETWLDGEGGDTVDKIFTDLGTLAGKAWINGFTTMAKGAVGELAEGNVSGALAMGATANAMTGGLLLSGGVGAGKWALGKAKQAKTAKAVAKATTNSQSTALVGPLQSAKNAKASKVAASSTKAVSATAKTTGTLGKTLNGVSKVGKYAGKAFVPLSLLSSAINIATSDNKAKATGSAGGSLAGGLAGAALGTAILPGIGTVVGGILGGIGGDWLGGKAGNWIGEKLGNGKSAKSTSASQSTNTNSNSTAQTFDATQLNASAASLATNLNATNTTLAALQLSTAGAGQNMSILTTYIGQASGSIVGSFTGLQTNAAGAAQNMAGLTTYIGQASGQVAGTFMPLQMNTASAAFNMAGLTTYIGQASGLVAGSFYPLKASTESAAFNMATLASYVGQASGWVVGGLSGIQSAGNRVVAALNNLEKRINSVQLPGTSGRLKYE